MVTHYEARLVLDAHKHGRCFSGVSKAWSAKTLASNGNPAKTWSGGCFFWDLVCLVRGPTYL